MTPQVSHWAAVGMRAYLSQDRADEIMDLVCDYFQVPLQKVKHPMRGKWPVVYCRDWIAYLLTRQTDLTLAEIGMSLGGRHWSTIIYARDKVKNNLKDANYTFHERFKRDYERLIELM